MRSVRVDIYDINNYLKQPLIFSDLTACLVWN
jgi:hypothetical protein